MAAALTEFLGQYNAAILRARPQHQDKLISIDTDIETDRGRFVMEKEQASWCLVFPKGELGAPMPCDSIMIIIILI